ncbi:MAG: nitroreductase family deazaflavin-dependent oxidoreductase [Myxococcota bacterium]|nr:nitroreductase family deazaflavin-dependent oxidoreductase [Myxococcota bacterium]
MPRFDYVKTARKDVEPIPPETVAAFRRRMGWYSRLNVLVYRLSFGQLMNTAMGGYPICIVTLRGKKTGRKRRIPLIHVPHGENEILVGSQAGLDRDPIWVRSLIAHPDITITFAGKSRRFRARKLDPDEKREAWPHLCSVYPAYDEYQARTDRDIPVFLASPVR